MDREDGFPAHIAGFIKRKREKEKQGDPKPSKAGSLNDERAKAVASG